METISKNGDISFIWKELNEEYVEACDILLKRIDWLHGNKFKWLETGTNVFRIEACYVGIVQLLENNICWHVCLLAWHSMVSQG